MTPISIGGRVCYPTTVHLTSRASLPTGSKIRACDIPRGKPYHPMTQGKIERWHLSLKSRILLENYYLRGDLERAVAGFVDHYNHRRYHESLDNLAPADVYFGRGARILRQREEIKRRTIEQRRRQHSNAAA